MSLPWYCTGEINKRKFSKLYVGWVLLKLELNEKWKGFKRWMKLK